MPKVMRVGRLALGCFLFTGLYFLDMQLRRRVGWFLLVAGSLQAPHWCPHCSFGFSRWFGKPPGLFNCFACATSVLASISERLLCANLHEAVRGCPTPPIFPISASAFSKKKLCLKLNILSSRLISIVWNSGYAETTFRRFCATRPRRRQERGKA